MMVDHPLEFKGKGFSPTQEESTFSVEVGYPKEFDIPPGQSIMIPSAIVEQARKSYSDTRHPSPISIELSSLIEATQSEEGQEWVAEAPFRLLASNERIYVLTTSMKDPKHPHADLQVMRLDYDPNTGEVRKVFRDCEESIFRRAVASFQGNTVIGKLGKVLEIEETTKEKNTRWIGIPIGEIEETKKNEGIVTNESLDAILAGLRPTKKDRLLSICGSGDVPFALLEAGCKVDAVDIDPKMIEDSLKQAKLLSEREFRLFLSRTLPWSQVEADQRRDFFSKGIKYKTPTLDSKSQALITYLRRLEVSEREIWEGDNQAEADFSGSRLEVLSRLVANVRFLNTDIITALNEGNYTKVFLSNVIGFNKDQEYDFAVQVFIALAKSLPTDGLFYSTIGNITSKYLERAYAEGRLPQDTFVLDEDKTLAAAGLQNEALSRMKNLGNRVYTWNPRVYKKAS